MSTTRGSTIRVRQSLRTRIYAASGLIFFGLAALLCIVLPRAYEHQAREDFGLGIETAARGFASLVASRLPVDDAGAASAADDMGRPYDAASEAMAGAILAELEPWLSSQTGIESAALLDADGATLGVWPTGAPMWSEGLPNEEGVRRGSSFYALSVPVPGPANAGRIVDRVAVRVSTARLVRTLENVRWLFFSVFLLGGVAFFGFTKYLTTTILRPLEDIRRVARDLADGERIVPIPEFGDDEISELGGLIDQLGSSRRHSRILRSPNELLARIADEAARRDEDTPDARIARAAEDESGGPGGEPDAKGPGGEGIG